jgi:hypothetical protein
MKKHLEEHEITAVVAGLELDAAAVEHLDSCVTCCRQVSAIRDAIEVRRAQLEAEAPDWERQRQEILLRLPPAESSRSGQRRPWTAPLLAVAAVLVAAVGLRVLWAPAPPADPATVSELPVEQILADVDAVLEDDSIPGFELIEPGLTEAIYENGTS